MTIYRRFDFKARDLICEAYEAVVNWAKFLKYNINNVKYCQECFSFDMPSDLWGKRVTNFKSKFTAFYLKV